MNFLTSLILSLFNVKLDGGSEISSLYKCSSAPGTYMNLSIFPFFSLLARGQCGTNGKVWNLICNNCQSLKGSESIRCERKTKEFSKGTDLQCSPNFAREVAYKRYHCW